MIMCRYNSVTLNSTAQLSCWRSGGSSISNRSRVDITIWYYHKKKEKKETSHINHMSFFKHLSIIFNHHNFHGFSTRKSPDIAQKSAKISDLKGPTTCCFERECASDPPPWPWRRPPGWTWVPRCTALAPWHWGPEIWGDFEHTSPNWLVVGPPLWKIWLSQLGGLATLWENKKWQPNLQPANQISVGDEISPIISWVMWNITGHRTPNPCKNSEFMTSCG